MESNFQPAESSVGCRSTADQPLFEKDALPSHTCIACPENAKIHISMDQSSHRINLGVECFNLHEQSLRHRTKCLSLPAQCVDPAGDHFLVEVGVGTVTTLRHVDTVRDDVIRNDSASIIHDLVGWAGIGVAAVEGL
jgi:hypothetical protein